MSFQWIRLNICVFTTATVWLVQEKVTGTLPGSIWSGRIKGKEGSRHWGKKKVLWIRLTRSLKLIFLTKKKKYGHTRALSHTAWFRWAFMSEKEYFLKVRSYLFFPLDRWLLTSRTWIFCWHILFLLFSSAVPGHTCRFSKLWQPWFTAMAPSVKR